MVHLVISCPRRILNPSHSLFAVSRYDCFFYSSFNFPGCSCLYASFNTWFSHSKPHDIPSTSNHLYLIYRFHNTHKTNNTYYNFYYSSMFSLTSIKTASFNQRLHLLENLFWLHRFIFSFITYHVNFLFL